MQEHQTSGRALATGALTPGWMQSLGTSQLWSNWDMSLGLKNPEEFVFLEPL